PSSASTLAHATLRLTISLLIPPPPRSTLFPYTTLFRSRAAAVSSRRASVVACTIGERARRARPRAAGTARVRFRRRRQRSLYERDRKSTRLNSSHQIISYAVFCLKKKITKQRHV